MDRAESRQPYGGAISKEAALVGAFMRRVYNWMAGGLAVSAILAYLTMYTEGLRSLVITGEVMNGYFYPTGVTMFFWICLIGEFGLVLALSAGIRRFSVGTAATMFMLYSGLTGLTLAPILLVYTTASVFKAFIVTAGTFGITSIWASTTKRDLSGWGSFLFMGLIGIILASVVNIFLGSTMIDWIVCIAGVGIFIGLAAYDTQQLRAMVLEAANEVTVSKMAIFGALKLYLDFINLFLLLLRLLGDRR